MIALLLTACAVLSSSEDTGCSIGSEGCDCTYGGGCNPSLTCVDDTCQMDGWHPDGLSIPDFFDDVAYDWESDRLYAIYDQSEFWDASVVLSLDLDDKTGESVSAFQTDLRVEHLASAPGLGGVAVSLSPSTWDSDDAGFGYVAFVDDGGIGPTVTVGVDPGDVDVDAAGNAYLCARAERVPPAAANLFTKETWSGDSYVRGTEASVELHPDGDRFYVADEGDLARWNITPQGLEGVTIWGDLQWGSDCHMDAIRVHPDGRTIWTDCGDVLLTTNDEEVDGTWIASLGVELDDLDFQPDGSHLYAIPKDSDDTILVFDGTTFQPTHEIVVASRPRRVLAGGDHLVVVRDSEMGTMALDVIAYPSDF